MFPAMKTAAVTLSILALAGAAEARSQDPAPARPGSDITRMLNGGPSNASPPPATVPAAETARPSPAPSAPPSAPVETRSVTSSLNSGPAVVAPTPSAVSAPAPRPSPPSVEPARAPVVTPSTAAPSPSPAPRASPTATAPVAAAPSIPAPAATAPASVAPAVAPAYMALDAQAMQALPFTVDLPAGFQLTTGRPGPNFNIYVVRRGDQPFVTVYVGPASQFPIYDGARANVGGRTSVVVEQDGRRVAMEHLFSQPGAGREVHIWLSSLMEPDLATAERIAQTIDVR